MKFVFFNLRSNWVDRSGIPDFRAADCGVVCFECTTQVNVRIVVSAMLKNHLGSLKKSDWSQDCRAAFMDSEGFGMHELEAILSRLHSASVSRSRRGRI